MKDARGFLHLVVALHLFGADVEQTDGGEFLVEQRPRQGGTENRKIGQLLGVAAHGCPDIEHDDIGAQRRPERRDRRPRDAFDGSEAEGRHGHQRPGIATGDRHVGLAVLDRLNRCPHRRGAAPLAQRLRGLFLHRDDDVGIDDARDLPKVGELVEQRRQLGLAAVEDEAGVLALAPEQARAFDGHARALVAAHGVNGDTDGIAHRRPVQRPLTETGFNILKRLPQTRYHPDASGA